MKPNWKNRTIWTGDNLPVMRGMNSESVDLIYLDPPFNSNKTYEAPIGSQAAGAAFKDTWTLNDLDEAWHGEVADQEPGLHAIIDAASVSHGKGMKSYLIMMGIRLLEMRRILKETGSIYLHCDPTASHYLKMTMDGIFGTGSFRNEVIWRRTGAHGRAKRWGPIHDSILYYSKPGQPTWNRTYEAYSSDYIEKFYRLKDDQEGKYQPISLDGPGLRSGSSGSSWRGVDPSEKSRHWELPPDRSLPKGFVFPVGYEGMSCQERLDILDAAGLIYWPKRGKVPRFKRFLSTTEGNPIQDVIYDIRPLSSHSVERVGYPTQKPLALLERIIQASSNPGDIVLDPFCGCATACIAAEKLKRHWAGIDLSLKAADLVVQRADRELGDRGSRTLFRLHHREDIPRRKDQGKIPNYRTHRHTLFGRQEGRCNGCRIPFPFRNQTVDHIVPQSAGGTDHLENLQLLCGACNSTKGSRTQEHLIAALKRQNALIAQSEAA